MPENAWPTPAPNRTSDQISRPRRSRAVAASIALPTTAGMAAWQSIQTMANAMAADTDRQERRTSQRR